MCPAIIQLAGAYHQPGTRLPAGTGASPSSQPWTRWQADLLPLQCSRQHAACAPLSHRPDQPKAVHSLRKAWLRLGPLLLRHGASRQPQAAPDDQGCQQRMHAGALAVLPCGLELIPAQHAGVIRVTASAGPGPCAELSMPCTTSQPGGCSAAHASLHQRDAGPGTQWCARSLASWQTGEGLNAAPHHIGPKCALDAP